MGALVAGIIGFWNDGAAFGLLVAIGAILFSHGVYDDFIKPRFRVEHRLNDWLQRRGWSVRIERLQQFNFALHLTESDTGKQVYVTRDKRTRDDLLAFTARVGLDPRWLPSLVAMSENQRTELIQEIVIFLAAKDVSLVLNDPRQPDSPISWPPDVKVQVALPQDHTLSQHSVDMAAKQVVLSMLGVRAIIRKAVIDVRAGDDRGSSSIPSPESTPDTASSQPQLEP